MYEDEHLEADYEDRNGNPDDDDLYDSYDPYWDDEDESEEDESDEDTSLQTYGEEVAHFERML
jgi:hypothetical protein